MSNYDMIVNHPPAVHFTTVPPGTYVIGDPCYSVADEKWIPWLEAADYKNPDNDHILVADINGHRVVGVHTYYGDGTYKDQHGNEYMVDAGMIGLVPIEVAEVNALGDARHVIEITEETEIGILSDDAVITLGDYDIDTDPRECDWCGDKIEKNQSLCEYCEEEQERQANACTECSMSEATTNEGLCDDCDAEINDPDEDEDDDDGEG